MKGRVCLALVVLLAAAPAAMADTVVLPNDGALPWTDPAHHSPLEQLASGVATRIADRPVTVQCDGETEWNTFAAQHGIDPAVELGYVPFRYTASRTISSGGDVAFLAPTVCSNLQQFGLAPLKPTKCEQPVSQTITVAQRYRATIRVRVQGRWVKRTVWRTRRVRRTVTSQRLAPCYLNGRAAASEPASYWQTYAGDALAILVLAHESIHLGQDRVGASVDAVLPTSETDANCQGLQWMPYVAGQLGATPDDAEAIAKYAYDLLYPGYRGVSYNGSPYWSADCRADGPLDLSPGDGVWP